MMKPWGCSASSTGCPATITGTSGPTSAPVLFDEMLRQDYQFGLFGALEDAKQYRQSLLAGLRKQVFVSRQTDDRRLIDDWQQWLGTRTADRPWFSLVYLSSPGIIRVPASIKGPFQPELTRFNPATAYRPENLQKLENRYKNAVFYTDQLLEQMLTQLQLQGLDDQTIVVVTSNHGQGVQRDPEQQLGLWQQLLDLSGAGPWCWPGLVPNLRPRRRRAATWIWYRPPDEEHAGCTQPLS